MKNDQIGRQVVTRASEPYGTAERAPTPLQRLPEIVRGFFGDPNLAYIQSS